MSDQHHHHPHRHYASMWAYLIAGVLEVAAGIWILRGNDFSYEMNESFRGLNGWMFIIIGTLQVITCGGFLIYKRRKQ